MTTIKDSNGDTTGNLLSMSVVPQVYTTPLVDFTVSNQFVSLNTLPVAGKKFVCMIGRLILLTRNASVTSSFTLNVSQNGVDLGGTAVTPGINVTAPAEVSVIPTAVGMVDVSAFPLQLHITTGAAGAGLTTCTGYYQITGIYI